MDELQPILNVLLSLLVAVVTAWVTVLLALHRFQSEKWFERRLDAYTKVIESLHHMKQTNDRQLRALERGYEIPEETENELTERYHKCLAELRRLTDMGALIFSAEAVKVLDAFNKQLSAASDEQTWWEHLDATGTAIRKCLFEIRDIAKRDLNA